MLCSLPSNFTLDAGTSGDAFSLSLSVGVVGGSHSVYVHEAVSMQRDKWNSISVSTLGTLPIQTSFDVEGFFVAPFRYVGAFYSSDDNLVLFTAPPIAADAFNLKFNIPVWLQNAATSINFDLLDAGDAAEVTQNNIYSRAVHHQNLRSSVPVTFHHVFGKYSPVSADILGTPSTTSIHVFGLGFDPSQRACASSVPESEALYAVFGSLCFYQCVFAADDPQKSGVEFKLVTMALVSSTREILCPIPMWPYHHAVARLQLLFEQKPVPFVKQGTVTSQHSFANFTFHQVWTLAQPSSGPVTGGTVISFHGYGFRTDEAYHCRLTGQDPPFQNITLNAQVVVGGGPGLITCVTDVSDYQWVGPQALLSLLGGDGLPVRQRSDPIIFYFQPEWRSISVSESSAAGGTRVTVRGAELGNANYRCVFADGMVEMESSADFLTNSEIACAVPVWPGKAAHISLRIIFFENNIPRELNCAQGTQPSNQISCLTASEPAEFAFLITAVVHSIYPNQIFAHEFSNTSFSVFGKGFDTNSTGYQCEGENFSVPAQALGSDILKCQSPGFWNGAAGNKQIKVSHNGIILEGSITLTVVQSITGVITVNTLASGGGLINVSGSGFEIGGQYICEVRLNGTSILNASATQITHNSFSCVLQSISSPAGEAELQVTQDTDDGSVPLIQISGKHKFDVLTSIDNISVFSGTAAGGDVISAYGHGFIPGNQYTAWFYRSTEEAVSVTCTTQDHGRLEFYTPSWRFSAGTTTLSFSTNMGLLNTSHFTFSFSPAVVSVASSSKAGAGTQSVVLVRGYGFNLGATYNLKFYSAENRSQFAEADGKAINASMIRCVSPLWPFAAASVRLNVTRNGHAISGNVLPFRFVSEIFSLSPNFGVLQGSLVSMKSAGLKAHGSYVCIISSNVSVQNVTAWVNPLHHFEQISPERFHNYEILCNMPPIRTCDEYLVTVGVKDMVLGEAIKGDFQYEYTEGLRSLTPSTGPATAGFAVTLTACGLHPSLYYRAALRGVSASDLAFTPNAVFTNSTSLTVIFPRWTYSSGRISIGLQVNNASSTQALMWEDVPHAEVHFDFFPVATSIISRKSGFVFGAYILIRGQGFSNRIGFHSCLLQSLTNGSEVFEVNAVGRAGSTELECEVLKWPFAASRVNVTLFYGSATHRRAIPHSEGPLTFELLPAWITANISSATLFSGGAQVSIRGYGFNPDAGAVYNCRFTVGACTEASDSYDCNLADSSGHTLPTQLRGPYVATSREVVMCGTPAWLQPEVNASELNLYEGDRLVARKSMYFPKKVTTTFVGKPLVAAAGNSPSSGGVIVPVIGLNFGLVDLTQRVRIGDSACEATFWLSSTSLSCKIPKAVNSSTFSAGSVATSVVVTVGPWRIGTVSNVFSYQV